MPLVRHLREPIYKALRKRALQNCFSPRGPVGCFCGILPSPPAGPERGRRSPPAGRNAAVGQLKLVWEWEDSRELFYPLVEVAMQALLLMGTLIGMLCVAPADAGCQVQARFVTLSRPSLLSWQTGANLTYCDMYNDKIISTRAQLASLDEGAKAVAQFLQDNDNPSQACKVPSTTGTEPELMLLCANQDSVRALSCAMQAGNGRKDDRNNCEDDQAQRQLACCSQIRCTAFTTHPHRQVVGKAGEVLCMDALNSCHSKRMLQQQCESLFKVSGRVDTVRAQFAHAGGGPAPPRIVTHQHSNPTRHTP